LLRRAASAPRGIFEVTKLNLSGRADSLSLKLRGSTLQGRALLGYSAPNTLANPRLSFQATTFVEKTQDINTFTESRYEASVQLTDQVSPRTTLLYRYSFRKILVSNLNIPPEEIPLFQQPTLVSEFGASWIRDTRNNPADASKGWLNSADFAIADTYLGSSASFIRFLYQNSSYHPIKRRFSFARSFRFGVLAPYRDTVSLTFPAPTQVPPPRVIPLPERLFAGGGTSLRGFALNQAGPRDSITGFPVGGQALLVFNQEFRFPMRLPFLGTRLGGTLFGRSHSSASGLLHRHHSFVPSRDHLSGAYDEGERLVPVPGAVELLAVFVGGFCVVQPARVMHGDLFAGRRHAAGANRSIDDLQARDVVHGQY
jgi:outer membrane protein assembly factor BamA